MERVRSFELFIYFGSAGLALIAAVQAFGFALARPREHRHRYFAAAAVAVFVWLALTGYNVHSLVDPTWTVLSYKAQSAAAVASFGFLLMFFRLELEAPATLAYKLCIGAHAAMFAASWVLPAGVFADALDLAVLADARARGASTASAYTMGPIAYAATGLTLAAHALLGVWAARFAYKKPNAKNLRLVALVSLYLFGVVHDLVRNLTGIGLPFYLTIVLFSLLVLLVNQRVLRDVLELTSAEQRLARAREMELFTQLAASLAHDFNNLVAAVLHASGRLMRATQGTPRLYDDALVLNEAGHSAAGLVSRLMQLGKTHAATPMLVRTNELVRRVGRITERIAGAGVEVVVEAAATHDETYADPAVLEAALLNLTRNGMLAMPNGGRLTLTTGNVEVTHEATTTYVLVPPPKHYVTVTVADEGVGIPKELEQRIFEPFFSTRPAKEGAGLGLSMVLGTLSELGGGLALQSRVGQGTRFTLYLPRIEREGMEATKAASLVGARRRVLLIDDTELVRTAVRHSLHDAGFDVLDYADGESALAHFSPAQAEVALVDLRLPGLSGVETIFRLRALDPALQIIITTGDTSAKELGAALALEGVRPLHKPFDDEALLASVGTAMSRRAQGS